MATNFKFNAEKPAIRSEKKEYAIEREWKKEREHVMALEKELKKHEKTSLQEAHPLPNMRK